MKEVFKRANTVFFSNRTQVKLFSVERKGGESYKFGAKYLEVVEGKIVGP